VSLNIVFETLQKNIIDLLADFFYRVKVVVSLQITKGLSHAR
jgi:hypothetical protein